ncbi:MAG: ribosome maturation factor RimM [Acidobacteriia bacterium]|nr:ribosome maturation factor RimM [Terriglobia bacterium]
MDPAARPSHIAIARIVRPRSNRGEVLVELHTDFPARFSLLNRVWVEFPDGRRECLELERCWEHQGRQVLKFGSIDSIADAEQLTGAWIEIEADQVVPLPEGTFWDHELIGCSVRNRGGELLGVVTDVMRIAGNHQLVVRGEHGEFLVPVVAAICKEISIARKEILVELPEGLMDLNP